ncbi:hypothetical protein Tco_1484951 [Tanacetum coccineum]
MGESAKRHEENSNLIIEIQASTDAAIQNQGASIKTLEIQIGQMSKSISTTIEADLCPIHRIRSSQYVVSTRQSRILMYETRQTTILFPSHLNGYYCKEKKGLYRPQFSELALSLHNPLPQKEKDPGVSLKITLKVREEKIIFKSVKSASSLIKMVYMLTLRERMEIDLEARLMGETLVLNRLLDPFFEDYIELNDLNEPFKLRRNQGDDLMSTIEEGEVIEEFRTRDKDLDTGIDDYPILEDMDAYRDDGMGDVIFGEPFLREVGIKTKRFKGIITLYNGDDEVSEKDVKNGISHAYQKLKGFYKGVLKLGPDYIRDAKMEEWLTRGHISVHEME